MSELTAQAVLRLGKTADWVVITRDAVWVGSTGPNAVSRIDPRTNRVTDTVALPGKPCARMDAGFGALWVPLCGGQPSLAKVSLKTRRVVAVFPVGTAAESGIAAGAGSLWMVTDPKGTLSRIEPSTGRVRGTTRVAAGSYNTLYDAGLVYVSDVAGALVTVVDARTGRVRFTAPTGPKPRFMTAGAGAVWTLNQGDGTLTRIERVRRGPSTDIALGTPGRGGDIAFGGGTVWTTVSGLPLSATDPGTDQVRRQWAGAGGDSLGVGFGAVWLTDYDGGTVSRFPLTALTGR